MSLDGLPLGETHSHSTQPMDADLTAQAQQMVHDHSSMGVVHLASLAQATAGKGPDLQHAVADQLDLSDHSQYMQALQNLQAAPAQASPSGTPQADRHASRTQPGSAAATDALDPGPRAPVFVTTGDESLQTIADLMGVSVDELRKANPELSRYGDKNELPKGTRVTIPNANPRG